MKRDEYIKNPDTIGSLYRALKEDHDGEIAKRLFGLANRWKAEQRVYRDKTYPPTAADYQFREALDAFLEWHDKHKEDRQAQAELPQEDPEDNVPF